MHRNPMTFERRPDNPDHGGPLVVLTKQSQQSEIADADLISYLQALPEGR